MPKIPESIVHYSRGEPFRSITHLSDAQIASLVVRLNETNAWGLSRFSDPQYLPQRREVENWMRKRFIELGGHPVLENPIYFFLGRNPKFEEDERNIGYPIHLQNIDPRSITFSYGDSMFCFHKENRRLIGGKYLNPLCEELYSLATLPRLLADPRFPLADPLPIEAHLWITPTHAGSG